MIDPPSSDQVREGPAAARAKKRQLDERAEGVDRIPRARFRVAEVQQTALEVVLQSTLRLPSSSS